MNWPILIRIQTGGIKVKQFCIPCAQYPVLVSTLPNVAIAFLAYVVASGTNKLDT